MLIEEAFPAKDSDGIVTVGMMRGTIKNGDAAYLLETGDRICMVNVMGLAVQDAVFSRADQSGRRDLLAFTDKYQFMLGDWNKIEKQENIHISENVGDQNDALRLTAIRFADCIDMVCSQNGKIGGITLNLYGEALIVLSGEMLDTIYKSGEFQRILRKAD